MFQTFLQPTNRESLFCDASNDVIHTASDMETIEFNVENLINTVHNEAVIWNATLNTSEEEKEIAW